MDEIWKDVAGFEGYYWVSNTGRVKSRKQELVLCHCGDKQPYYIVSLCAAAIGKKDVKVAVHRLVAEAFLERKPEDRVVRHLDGNHRNNHVSNLAWGSYSDNNEDMRAHKTMVVGSRAWNSKLTEDDVRAIRKDPRSSPQLEKVYGVSARTIRKARSGYKWKHVE